MRTVLRLGRLSLRPRCANLSRLSQSIHGHHRTYTSFRPFANFRTPQPPAGVRRLLFAGAALGPAAFVTLSQQGDDGHGKTGEQQMLEASRKELKEQVPKRLENSKGRRSIYLFVEAYIVEPIGTALRFLHLVFIFVPVIVTIPAIYFGARQKDRADERSGTLWWYGFLVGSMERAGAAFIKVRLHREDYKLLPTYHTPTARTMGRFPNRHLSHRVMQYHVRPPL